MNSLIKSRNVEKVINFANVSRDKSVYEAAAAFLQTCEFHFGQKIATSILQFLAKSKNIPGYIFMIVDFLFMRNIGIYF